MSYPRHKVEADPSQASSARMRYDKYTRLGASPPNVNGYKRHAVQFAMHESTDPGRRPMGFCALSGVARRHQLAISGDPQPSQPLALRAHHPQTIDFWSPSNTSTTRDPAKSRGYRGRLFLEAIFGEREKE